MHRHEEPSIAYCTPLSVADGGFCVGHSNGIFLAERARHSRVQKRKGQYVALDDEGNCVQVLNERRCAVPARSTLLLRSGISLANVEMSGAGDKPPCRDNEGVLAPYRLSLFDVHTREMRL